MEKTGLFFFLSLIPYVFLLLYAVMRKYISKPKKSGNSYTEMLLLNILGWITLVSNFIFIIYTGPIFLIHPENNKYWELTSIPSYISTYYFICFLVYFVLIICAFFELIFRKLKKINKENIVTIPKILSISYLWIGISSIIVSLIEFCIWIYIILCLSVVFDMLDKV